MLTLTGGTVTPGAEVLVLPPTTTVTNMGPLASDGTMYAFTYVSNGALTLAYTNLSGTPISSATQPGWLPATEGFAYDTGLAKYVTAASSTSSIALIASTPSLPITTIASSTQTVTAFALGHGGSTYYLATADSNTSSCSLTACTSSACAPSTPLSTSCQSVKVAGGTDLSVFADTAGTTLKVILSGNAVTAGPLQALLGLGYLPLATGTSPFHVI